MTETEKEEAKNKLISASKKQLDVLDELLKACGVIKKASKNGDYTRWANYKSTLQEVINKLTAEYQVLKNHIFNDPQENPLEKFVEAQDKEIQQLKKENRGLRDRIIALEKLAELGEAGK